MQRIAVCPRNFVPFHRFRYFRRWPMVQLLLCLSVVAAAFTASTLMAEDRIEPEVVAEEDEGLVAQWIWTPKHRAGDVPSDTCFFRKTISLSNPEAGEMAIAADDKYEVYVNGKLVGSGDTWDLTDRYDISEHLIRGKNAIAVEVTNTDGGHAGLAAQIAIKEEGETPQGFVTDGSWKTSLFALRRWNASTFPDLLWARAQVLGPIRTTDPWVDEPEEPGPLATEEIDAGSMSNLRRSADAEPTPAAESTRVEPKPAIEMPTFGVRPNFNVQMVAEPDKTGSLIAVAFDENGDLIASREGGGLLRVRDSNGDGIPDRGHTYCSEVTNCQGIVSLNGGVYVVGDGPQGAALYWLKDTDKDDELEVVKPILQFTGEMDELGPHGVAFGPDDHLYVSLGNRTKPVAKAAKQSPYRNSYEGDFAELRLIAPTPKARGVRAPGGRIIRCDLEGEVVETVAGGLRNAYDLAFTAAGDLFVADSDMEDDKGLPWYRAPRLCLVTPGADFGWRSGSGKWPAYFYDSLPPVFEFTQTTPAGMVAYDHVMLPKEYRGALFVCDWQGGRIMAVLPKRKGAGFVATSKVFLEGDPQRITDVDVAPDGSIYFACGGRGAKGGIYRVVYEGELPNAEKATEEGVAAIVRQPQLQSAWARREIADVKEKLGDSWSEKLLGVATEPKNSVEFRIQALATLRRFDESISTTVLTELSRDEAPAVRAQVAAVSTTLVNQATRDLLTELLNDEDARVRRTAVESLMDRSARVKYADIAKLLESEDRYESFAARRLLEGQEVAAWKQSILETDRVNLFVQGALAMMIVEPSKSNGYAIVDRAGGLMLDRSVYISDAQFVDMMRLLQVAISQGQLRSGELIDLKNILAREYPCRNARMNREMVRLLVQLGATDITDRFVKQFHDVEDKQDKLHLAAYVANVDSGFSSGGKATLLSFYENQLEDVGQGAGYSDYMQQMLRRFAGSLSESERHAIIHDGANRPAAALAALYHLPTRPSDKTLAAIRTLDASLAGDQRPVASRLRVGTVAILCRSGDPESIKYLERVFEQQPNRRDVIAMGFAKRSGQQHFDYLVRSLPTLSADTAPPILEKLLACQRKATAAQHVRQLIVLGIELDGEDSQRAISLLEHWTGERLSDSNDAPDVALAAWQQWYSRKYPGTPVATPVSSADESEWTTHRVLALLNSSAIDEESTTRGAEVFRSANCAACHDFGDNTGRVGPVLSGTARRLHRKQLVDAILHPDREVHQGYQTYTLTADGRQITGVIGAGSPGQLAVLTNGGRTIYVREEQVTSVQETDGSVMPSGLLDSLSPQEVADLMTFLLNAPQPQITELPGPRSRE
jgi:putative heme-binding domain-containing protein